MEEFTKYLSTSCVIPSDRDDCIQDFSKLSESDQQQILDHIQTIKGYDASQLVEDIQPIINKKYPTPQEDFKMLVCMTEYKSRSLDMEYFINGAGSPNNCILS